MKLFVSPSPHITSDQSVTKIMMDVVIALMFPLIGGVYFFGIRALLVTAISVASAVLAEFVWDKATKRENSITDLSAVVTGMLLAFSCPVSIPLWMIAVGNIFAIIIVKQCFGGIGKNFMNPALAARAFMMASFPAAMTHWSSAAGAVAGWDAVSSATPLASGAGGYSYLRMFLGTTPGCIGETSELLILIGAAYLILQRVIDLRIPVAYIGSIALFTWIFDGQGFFNGDPLFHILSGGVMLGAFFMATDYTTSPISKTGHIIFGIGCGIITGLIRVFGSFPEGVTYSILLMNALVPMIDKITLPKKFGTEASK